MKQSVIAMAVVLVCGAASADPQGPRIGSPSFSGTACSEGSVVPVLTPDESVLTLMFFEYLVEAGGNITSARATCDVAVPIEVPAGYRIADIQIDYRGYALIAKDNEGRFDATYRLDGFPTRQQQQKMRGPFDDVFFQTHNIRAHPRGKPFECGQSSTLMASTSLWATSKKGADLTYLAMDSADITPGMAVSVRWETCRSR